MIKQILILIVGILMSSAILFISTVCIFYVLGKEYDALALYVISLGITLTLSFYYFYERYLSNKAAHAFNHQDYETAFAITQKLAKKDRHEAQYQLSLMYRDGIGVEQDEDEFWYWLEKAAVHNPDAQFLYANSYLLNKSYSLANLEVARRYLDLCVKHENYHRRQEAAEQLINVERLIAAESQKQ